MIANYHLLADRLRDELQAIEHVVAQAEAALARVADLPTDAPFLIASAALDLHGFYSGLERLFEQTAREVDGGIPTGSHWHRDLLDQMTRPVTKRRPAVLRPVTRTALDEYLGFRHRVRNLYTYDLDARRVTELVRDLRPTFELVHQDLLAFATFLDSLASADEDN